MPKTLIWKQLLGQERIKKSLAAAFNTESLGHAYLLCGAPGVGKFQTALELSLALLCEKKDRVPCYSCDSCLRVLSASHPDFHCLFPVSLQPNHTRSHDSTKLSEEGWRFITEETRYKLKNPYIIDESRMNHIPVEWIRELNRAILRGPVSSTVSVSIISGVDILQPASANAMLKTLEEPPPNTLILLLTHRFHSVLLTIRSRCQIIRFGLVSSQDIVNTLSENFAEAHDRKKLISTATASSGSFGRALQLLDETFDVYDERAKTMWELCIARSSVRDKTQFLEQLFFNELNGGKNYTTAEKIILCFHQIVRQTFFHTINGAEKYIYFEKLPSSLTLELDVRKVDDILIACENSISAIRSRGNVLLVLYTFIVSVSEIIHGKK